MNDSQMNQFLLEKIAELDNKYERSIKKNRALIMTIGRMAIQIDELRECIQNSNAYTEGGFPDGTMQQGFIPGSTQQGFMPGFPVRQTNRPSPSDEDDDNDSMPSLVSIDSMPSLVDMRQAQDKYYNAIFPPDAVPRETFSDYIWEQGEFDTIERSNHDVDDDIIVMVPSSTKQ